LFRKTHPATKVQLRNAGQILLRQHGRVKRKKKLAQDRNKWKGVTEQAKTQRTVVEPLEEEDTAD
jgi:hypothetical protein